MKKSLLAFLLVPFFCMAAGGLQPFPKFNPKFDSSEMYFYGNFQTSFNRMLGGLGIRYIDAEIGFDGVLGVSPETKKDPRMLQAQLALLYYPFEEYVYASFGGGISAKFKKSMTLFSFFDLSLGGELRTKNAGKYFAEISLQSPTDFNLAKTPVSPGIRIGVGY